MAKNRFNDSILKHSFVIVKQTFTAMGKSTSFPNHAIGCVLCGMPK
jgi:hypothetical protein